MKKLLVMLSLLILLSGCGNKKEDIVNKDALKFKEEYSMLNIKEKNPYVYSTEEEVLKILKKEGVILIGNKDNKETIKLLEEFNEAVNNTGLNKVYYLNNNYENILKKLNKKDIPILLFIKDGKIIEVENNEKSYETAIHEVLDDLCDREC